MHRKKIQIATALSSFLALISFSVTFQFMTKITRGGASVALCQLLLLSLDECTAQVLSSLGCKAFLTTSLLLVTQAPWGTIALHVPSFLPQCALQGPGRIWHWLKHPEEQRCAAPDWVQAYPWTSYQDSESDKLRSVVCCNLFFRFFSEVHSYVFSVLHSSLWTPIQRVGWPQIRQSTFLRIFSFAPFIFNPNIQSIDNQISARSQVVITMWDSN